MFNGFQFLVFWLRFSLAQSWVSTFGWSGAMTPVIWEIVPGAFWVAHLPPRLINMFDNETPIGLTLLGISAAFIVSWITQALFVAPKMAWGAVYPLKLAVGDQTSTLKMVQDTVEKHQVWVFVKHRSPIKSLHYTLSVLQEPEKYQDRHPWQIHSGVIPPRDKHRVLLANWFFGGAHGEQGDIVVFNERSGAFAAANLRNFSSTGADLCLLACAFGCPSQKMWCRVFVDQTSKKLILRRADDH